MRWVGADGAGYAIVGLGSAVAFCLLFTPVRWLRYQSVARDGAWVTAKVVDVQTEYSSGGHGKHSWETTEYFAEVEFKVEDGRLFQVRLEVPEEMERGAELPIVYDPDDPIRAHVAQDEKAWAAEMRAGLGGAVVFAAIGIAILFGIGAIELD